MFGASLMNLKEKTLIDRIGRIEGEITKGREYLESGQHADWQGFRPLFVDKVRDGKVLPPHKDWVKNVFLPNHEKSLMEANKLLERLAGAKKKNVNQISEVNNSTGE